MKAGLHLIIDFVGGKDIKKTELRKILLEAAKQSKNTPLGIKTHGFLPCGVSGVILLSESHISIHTWPEHNYTAIDIFSCGEHSEPKAGLKYLKEVFQPTKVRVKTIKRGI